MPRLVRTGVFSGNPVCSIRRDPFARATLMRETIRNKHLHRCAWCGQDKPRLYAYAWVSDSRPDPSTLYPVNHFFCEVDCWEAYSN